MMKNILFLLALATTVSFAQPQLPPLSLHATLKQEIGFTNFEVRYSRPSARGREIFGQLVPYKKMWRTGANQQTTISFDKDVTINGKKVSAGIYALATIPDKSEWTILLNSDTSKVFYEAKDYDVKKEVARLTAKSQTTSRFTETFTIDLEQKQSNGIVVIAWENTEVKFEIKTGAHEQAMAAIDSELKKRPSDHELK